MGIGKAPELLCDTKCITEMMDQRQAANRMLQWFERKKELQQMAQLDLSPVTNQDFEKILKIDCNHAILIVIEFLEDFRVHA